MYVCVCVCVCVCIIQRKYIYIIYIEDVYIHIKICVYIYICIYFTLCISLYNTVHYYIYIVYMSLSQDLFFSTCEACSAVLMHVHTGHERDLTPYGQTLTSADRSQWMNTLLFHFKSRSPQLLTGFLAGWRRFLLPILLFTGPHSCSLRISSK